MPEYGIVTQKSGPLTKAWWTDNYGKVAWAARQQCRDGPPPGPYLWKKSEDKLELYLALFGYAGAHYVLTFRDADLPDSFGGVRQCFRAFLTRVRRWEPSALQKYVYAVEAGHEHGRWHIHFVADARELSMEDAAGLWRYGFVNPGRSDYPVLRREDGYRGLAEYFCKPDEFIPLGKHPWGVPRGMKSMIPPPAVRVSSRKPRVPKESYYSKYTEADTYKTVNGFSTPKSFYANWVALPKPGEYIYCPEKTMKK